MLFISTACFSQNKKSPFQNVDDKILKLPAYNSDNLDSLAILLTKEFSTEKEKVRAIFVWVANNVSYNVPKYAERNRMMNVILKKADDGESAVNVIRSRKAVCEGYSNLIKALCNKSGIACETIQGIGRPDQKPADLHGWNAVKIDGEWKLLDATWASGGINLAKNKFENRFDDTFFLTNPLLFIKTHYPFDPVWQLSPHPITRKAFESSLQKTSSPQDSTYFNFNDTLNFYFQQDSISQLISSNRRTLAFDPENNFAEQNLDNLINYSENEKMNKATKIFQEGVNQYNECTEIINEAKRTRSTKKMNASETRLKQLVKDSKSNMDKAIELYKSVKFTDNTNAYILESNIDNGKKNIVQLDTLNKYLENYYNTPKMLRVSAL